MPGRVFPAFAAAVADFTAAHRSYSTAACLSKPCVGYAKRSAIL